MILRMSRPDNALNVPDFDLAKVETLLTPTKLCTRTEVLARPCPVPASAGVYAWFFDSCPQGVPTEGLVRSVGLALLYAGISPKPPSAVGTPEPPDAPEQASLSLPRKRGRLYSPALARLPIVAELGH
jgi:hypothetical protein